MTGAALVAALDSLADLRIAVFRALPCLYDSDHGYARDYLTAYANSPGALVVGTFAGDRLPPYPWPTTSPAPPGTARWPPSGANAAFTPVDGLICQFSWKDMEDAAESDHPMPFWVKQLA